MSLIDIRNAKEALRWRLKEWGCDGDLSALAGSFIDDLVDKGWRMDAMREDRPQPPKSADACPRCGGVRGSCHCTREHRAVSYDDDHEPDPHQTPTHADASLARALMAQTKASLCGCGVRRGLCPVHRVEEEV